MANNDGTERGMDTNDWSRVDGQWINSDEDLIWQETFDASIYADSNVEAALAQAANAIRAYRRIT